MPFHDRSERATGPGHCSLRGSAASYRRYEPRDLRWRLPHPRAGTRRDRLPIFSGVRIGFTCGRHEITDQLQYIQGVQPGLASRADNDRAMGIVTCRQLLAGAATAWWAGRLRDL
ncbi:hypothetical protein GCM10010306_025540 [Streptomyces umbrinus]|nr:hypothetical protein GCM10010306_025540 [Streptomyces umbrinus]